MLQQADAAILIGDPALLALESREAIEHAAGPCQWLDLAHEWHTRTSLPWVAAVWAVRPEALAPSGMTAASLTRDLEQSRDHGLAHIDQLVEQWTPRIPIPSETIRHYLTHNIHYTLDTRLHPRHAALPPICRRSRSPAAPPHPAFPVKNSPHRSFLTSRDFQSPSASYAA